MRERIPGTFHRIERYEAESLWRGRHPQGAEYGGPPTIQIGTGRARCRACGQRIARGDGAVLWAHDYQGSGSWTAIQSYIHASNCLDQAVAR